MLSKEREIFKNIYNKKLDKIDELSETIDYGDLKFIVKSGGLKTNFSELKDPVTFHYSIKKREISTEVAQHKQEEFNTYLKKIELEINLKSEIKHG